MVKVIDRLRMPQVVKQKGNISNDITITEHIQGWKKLKEQTASIQGELIFNDLEAGSQDKTITDLDCLVRVIPYSKGFYPVSY